MEIERTTVAFVTGGGRGIGAAIADRLRAAGATVVTADLRGADIPLDVTDLAGTRDAVARIVAEHGHLDLAVACAGVGVAGAASEIADADWERSIAVNLEGTANTIRAAYEVILPRRRGHLVAIASLAGLVPTPLLVPYAMTKGGVVSLMTSPRLLHFASRCSPAATERVVTHFMRRELARSS